MDISLALGIVDKSIELGTLIGLLRGVMVYSAWADQHQQKQIEAGARISTSKKMRNNRLFKLACVLLSNVCRGLALGIVCSLIGANAVGVFVIYLISIASGQTGKIDLMLKIFK